MYRSRDEERSWSQPQILSRGPLDDRDTGVVEAADGSLLINFFTSLAFFTQKIHEKHFETDWKAELERITLADIFRHHGFLCFARPTEVKAGASPTRSRAVIRRICSFCQTAGC